MADAVETFSGPPAVDQSGNLTIWWVPTIADVSKPKLTEIGGVGSGRITYSFTPGGWSLSATTERLTDDRLTSPVSKEALGRTSPTLADLNYVDSSDPKSAAVLLPAAGGTGYFVERRNAPQSELGAVGDKVRVIKVSLGPQVPGPTDGTGKFTITQAVAIDTITLEPVAVLA